MVSLNEDPMQPIHGAIHDLMRSYLNNWPEQLAAQAGTAGLMDSEDLSLLADATVQIARQSWSTAGGNC